MILQSGRNMCISPINFLPFPMSDLLTVCPLAVSAHFHSDMQNSRLRFNGKAILHSEGVDFSSGQSFSLRLEDLIPQGELGRGNYGTVTHVVHRVTNAHMAMKQIKLELDTSKFNTIITELQVFSPFHLS